MLHGLTISVDVTFDKDDLHKFMECEAHRNSLVSVFDGFDTFSRNELLTMAPHLVNGLESVYVEVFELDLIDSNEYGLSVDVNFEWWFPTYAESFRVEAEAMRYVESDKFCGVVSPKAGEMVRNKLSELGYAVKQIRSEVTEFGMG